MPLRVGPDMACLECYRDSMNALKAHVKNGQIILDQPEELIEGAPLLVFRVTDDMSNQERAELEQSVEDGAEDFERGDFEDAREFAARLAAKP